MKDRFNRKAQRQATRAGQRTLSRDPAQLTTLRRQFAGELKRGYAALGGKIIDLLVHQDALGLKDRKAATAPTSPVGNLAGRAYPYASVQLDVAATGLLERIRAVQEALDPEDVIKLEDEPHVTVRYGLHASDGLLAKVQGLLAHSLGQLRVTLGGLSLFLQEDMDVLKADVASGGLHELNRRLGSLPNTVTHPDYNPHLTIAYLKRGTGAKYTTSPLSRMLDGLEVRSTTVTLSPPDRQTREVTVNAGQWSYETNSRKVERFRAWLRDQMDSTLAGDALIEKYIEQGHTKGISRAHADTTRGRAGKGDTASPVDELGNLVPLGGSDRASYLGGAKAEFIRRTTRHPVTVDQVKLLAGRTFAELDGVNQVMASRMSRALADGLVKGKTNAEIATDLVRETKIAGARAAIIVRTELARAHAEGQLNAMSALGVKSVGAAVEWTTGDAPCAMCQPLDGVILSVEEARGLLPRHPQCLCSWQAVTGPGEDSTVDAKGVRGAMKASRKAQGLPLGGKGARDGWGGGVKVTKDRPVGNAVDTFLEVANTLPAYLEEVVGYDRVLRGEVANSFCPTGRGGGVDPTCSPMSASEPTGGEPSKKSTEAGSYYDRLTDDELDKRHAELVKAIQQEESAIDRNAPHSTLRSSMAWSNRRTLRIEQLRVQLTTASRTKSYKGKAAWLKQANAELKELIEGTRNTFCPTGEGGGVDPTCSPTASRLLAHVVSNPQGVHQGKATDDLKMKAKDVKAAAAELVAAGKVKDVGGTLFPVRQKTTSDRGEPGDDGTAAGRAGATSVHEPQGGGPVREPVGVGRGGLGADAGRGAAGADTRGGGAAAAGVPGGEGGAVVSSHDLPSVRSKAAEYVSRMKNDGLEHGGLFDSSGKLLWEGKGRPDELTLPSDIANRPDVTLVHTHPTEVSFTAGDWVSLLRNPTAGFTAETATTSHSLQREANLNSIAKKASKLSDQQIADKWGEYAREFVRSEEGRGMAPRARVEKANSYASSKLASEFGFKYTETPHSRAAVTSPSPPRKSAADVAKVWGSLPGAQHNQVSIADLHERLGHADLRDTHDLINRMRREGKLFAEQIEGGRGSHARELAHAIHEHDQHLGYVGVRDEHRATFNTFCPTGPGGGVDPSCSPGGEVGGYPKSIQDMMTKAREEAVASRHGDHGKAWEEVAGYFPKLATPVFSTTSAAIQVMEGGFNPGKESRFGGAAGGNVGSVSMSSNLDWATKGGGSAFGRYTFVMDEKDLLRHGSVEDHQDPSVLDYEFERRFTGGSIPPSEIRGLVVSKHMGRMEKEEAADWPFPVVYKDNLKGWTLVEKRTKNTFCPTGPGGGVDPSCSPSPTPSSRDDKAKYVGQKVGAAEQEVAAGTPVRIARALGGKTESEVNAEEVASGRRTPGDKDKKPYDVKVPKRVSRGKVDEAAGYHDLEVKTLVNGSKQSISVHDDALLRKVEHAERNPANTFHTVVRDARAEYAGGKFKENYSGHDLYYKRGSGRYALSKMYKVKDEAELGKLLNTKDDDLPEKARGRLPSGELELKKLRAGAARAKVSRDARNKDRKERNKEKLREQARARRAKAREAKQAASSV